MIRTKRWKRAGAMILGFVSHGFCTENTFMAIVAGEDSEQDLRVNEEVLTLGITGYRLEDSQIRELGKCFPNASEVFIHKAPPSCEISGGNPSEVVPCKKVKKVMVYDGSNGSPTMLESIKVLFPGAIELCFGSNRAMPIHDLKDAEICRENKLMMKEVTSFWVTDDTITAVPEILFENLRLFPSVETLSISGCILESATGEDIRKADLVLSHVKKLNGYGFPVDQGFLSRVPTMFPSVEELWINKGALERMTTRVEEGVDPCFFFEKLTKLKIYSDEGSSAASGFGGRTSEVFPVLSSVELSFPSVDALLWPRDIIAVKTVKTVKIYGDLECPPDFFDELFPELTSLIMSREGLKKLSKGKYFYHPQLRDLDISDNEDLEKILEGMEEAQGGSDGVPVGGLYLPCLESLNICGSFECKVPECFLQGCLGIKTLRMSVYEWRYSCDSEGSWWEFLGPLLALEELHVGIVPLLWEDGRPEEFAKRVLRDLGSAKGNLTERASVHFYSGRYFSLGDTVLAFQAKARSGATANE